MSLSIEKRWEIVFLSRHPKALNLSNGGIAKYMKCGKSTVSKWLTRYAETGDVQDKDRTGRPRVTTPKEDLGIIKQAIRNPETTVSNITEDLKKRDTVVSKSTVSRRLHEAGLQSKSPLLKPLLSNLHRKNRLQWRLEHEESDWDNVIFTNETSIMLDTPRRGRRSVRSFAHTTLYL